ncbi:hypothetical protein Tco_0687884 [Tanacetum coccineum]
MGVNILKSIDECTFSDGTFGNSCSKVLCWIRGIKNLIQGLPKGSTLLSVNYTDAKGHMGQCDVLPGRFGINTKKNRESNCTPRLWSELRLTSGCSSRSSATTATLLYCDAFDSDVDEAHTRHILLFNGLPFIRKIIALDVAVRRDDLGICSLWYKSMVHIYGCCWVLLWVVTLRGRMLEIHFLSGGQIFEVV